MGKRRLDLGTAQFPVTVPWSQTPTVELHSDLLKVVMEPKSLSGRFLNKKNKRQTAEKLPPGCPGYQTETVFGRCCQVSWPDFSMAVIKTWKNGCSHFKVMDSPSPGTLTPTSFQRYIEVHLPILDWKRFSAIIWACLKIGYPNTPWFLISLLIEMGM